ncbi:MAG TPA: helix-turn-helix domain-containing protein, partial [Candidatus Bathyarchaeia archaeon]
MTGEGSGLIFEELEGELEKNPRRGPEILRERLGFQERLRLHAALTHDTRLDILRILAEKAPLSFSQLRKAFQLNPNTLAYHLRVLEETRLVAAEFEKERGKREFSNYQPTELGHLMLKIDDYTKWL